MLAADERADGVDFEESPHVVGRDGVERRRRPGGGVVHQQVEPAEVAAGAVDHRAGGVFVAELGAEGGRFVAGVGQFVDQLGGAIERLVGVDGDAIAGRGQRANDRGARRGRRRRSPVLRDCSFMDGVSRIARSKLRR